MLTNLSFIFPLGLFDFSLDLQPSAFSLLPFTFCIKLFIDYIDYNVKYMTKLIEQSEKSI